MNIEINVSEIDLDTVIAKTVAFDDDGDAYTTGERRLGDAIVLQLVERVVRDNAYGNAIRERVQRIRDEEIRAAVQPIIAEAVAAPVQKTNSYGEPMGAATTMREVIVDQVRKFLEERPDSYRNNNQTRMSLMVRAEVEAVFKKELAAEVQKARDAVLAEVGGLVGEQVQATIRAALATKAKEAGRG